MGHGLGFLPALDGIRGVAVLAVVLYHSTLLCGFEFIAWAPVVRWGWAGVEMFFVLSGFLITRILLNTRHQNGYWVKFLARRALRIFPAYYLCLVMVWLLVPMVSDAFASSDVRGQLFYYLVYLQNWKIAFDGWPDWPYVAHFWSLAVEEQFYLAWPLVVLALGRSQLVRVCLLLIVASVLFGVMVTFHDDIRALMGYVSTFAQLYALCAGSVLAAIPKARLAAWFGSSARVAMLLAALAALWFVSLKLFVVAATAATVAAIAAGRNPVLLDRALNSTVLRWFGKYSYGIYLLHYPLLGVMFDNLGEHIQASMQMSPNATAIGVAGLVTALVALIAFLQFTLVERHFLRMKGHFAYQRQSAPAAALGHAA